MFTFSFTAYYFNNAHAATATIRQEINIIDGTLAVNSTSSASVQIDRTRYSGTATFYFEVVTASSSASTDSVTLINKATLNTEATISLAGTNANVRVRSSSFTPLLSVQNEFVVKTGANHSIKAARVIIIQSITSTANLYGTQTQIEIGNQETGKTNTTASPLTNPKYWKYTAADWDGSKGFSAEVVQAQSATNFTGTVTLQQDNGSFASWTDVATIVANNSTTAATRYRVNFTPTDGRNYRISALESASSGGKNYSIYAAKIIIDQGWVQAGNSFSVSNEGIPAIGALSTSRIAFFDDTNSQLRAYDFNGTSWSLTGSGLNITCASCDEAIAAMSSSRIVYYDDTSSQLRAYDFNGSTWSLTGTPLSIASNASPHLTALSSTRIVFTSNGQSLTAYDFNGSTWSQTGNIFGSTARGPIAALSASRVALYSSGLKTFDFDGTNWTQTGNTLSITNGLSSITSLSSTRIAALNQQIMNIYDFDGTNWTQTLSSFSIDYSNSCGFNNLPQITALTSTRVAYSDLCNAQIRAYDAPSATLTKIEPQYLLQNTVAAATGLQSYPTFWSSSEWSGVSNTYKHVIDSTNSLSAAKLQDIDNANTDVTNSAVTGTNQIFSSNLTMPTSGHQIDENITANATTVTADRIIAFVTVSTTNSAPNTPTLTAPSSGATGVSTTPTFSFSDTDPDSDDIQFVINLFQSNCTTAVTTYNMTSGQTGWSPTFNGTAGSGLTYTSSTAGSGVSFTPSSALSNSTTYCWSVGAKDPGGSNTTTTSGTQLFTTAAPGPSTDQVMRGGKYFNSGSEQPYYWAQ